MNHNRIALPKTITKELPVATKFEVAVPLAQESSMSAATVIERKIKIKKSAKLIPFVLIHLACVAVLFVGIGLPAVLLCIGLYAVRMFALTAGYHRYFSHRSFKTSRVFQFVLALVGTLAVQKGPLWWAAH